MDRRLAGAELITEEIIKLLARRFGNPHHGERARVFTFGSALTCSLNYSKLLHGNKYFFGLPTAITDPNHIFPKTRFGEFVLLICGSADKVLVIPRPFMLDMMKGVSSRRVDVFTETESYILQTTKHPKVNVTDFLNSYPTAGSVSIESAAGEQEVDKPDRVHLRMQYQLVTLGRLEGCSIWVPVNDRNLSYQKCALSSCTTSRLPNFGFDENTRRIVQNIDVLWLKRNVIRKAFEIESTTSIYSGLLRLNDLVLAQPNIQIDLYLVANKARRGKVFSQLTRPSFHELLPKCEFLTFEEIDDKMRKLDAFPVESGARVSGLLRGEKFAPPEDFLYPENL